MRKMIFALAGALALAAAGCGAAESSGAQGAPAPAVSAGAAGWEDAGDGEAEGEDPAARDGESDTQDAVEGEGAPDAQGGEPENLQDADALDGLGGGGAAGAPEDGPEDEGAAAGDSEYAVIVNGGAPYFTDGDLEGIAAAGVSYSALDEADRCGPAAVLAEPDSLRAEEMRASSGARPTGWSQGYYGFLEGDPLYARCELAPFLLGGDETDVRNLVTGTQKLCSMLTECAQAVADHVSSGGGSVYFRATPVFDGTDALARGVLVEALGKEDPSFFFCVFLKNAQPGVEIDYSSGANAPDGTL